MGVRPHDDQWRGNTDKNHGECRIPPLSGNCVAVDFLAPRRDLHPWVSHFPANFVRRDRNYGTFAFICSPKRAASSAVPDQLKFQFVKLPPAPTGLPSTVMLTVHRSVVAFGIGPPTAWKCVSPGRTIHAGEHESTVPLTIPPKLGLLQPVPVMQR